MTILAPAFQLVDASGNPEGTQANPFYTAPQSRSYQTVTILNGASVSGSIDLSDTSLLGFVSPAAWTTAALNLEVSTDNINWQVAYDAYGSQVGSIATPVVAASYAADAIALLPWAYVRFRSGTSATPVVQGADRTFKVVKRVLA